jgi:cell division protein FtsA
VVEIIEQIYLEIKNYGHEEQKKKLIAGIVLTGGGAQLQHLKQLVEYITGMDTRIGYPNEHLAGDSDSETTSPLYATAVGLVLNSLQSKHPFSGNKRFDHVETAGNKTNEAEKIIENEVVEEEPKERKRFFDKWAEKFKEFLDNAE